MPRITEAQAEGLRTLRGLYRDQLPARMRSVVDAARALGSDAPGREQVEALFHLSHRLTGSSAIYGFASVSREAGALEAFLTGLLEAPDPLRVDRATLEGLISRLETAVEARGAEGAAPESWGKGRG